MNADFNLSLDSLSFTYPGGERVFTVPSIIFESGRISVLLGANGTGKTTLLKVMAGILKQDTGSVTVGTTGKEAAVSWPDDMLYIHQDPYLLTGTVEQSISLLVPQLRKRSSSATDFSERVDSILSDLGLHGFGKRSMHKLSGGEKKRIALACALMADRSIVLMDEPTAHMDDTSILLLEGQIRRLRNSGRLIIIATHNREFAFRLADTVWQIENGIPEVFDYTSFQGSIVESDEYFSYFRLADIDPPVELKVVQAPETITTAVIRSTDIILSLQPLVSSARNIIKGVVSEIVTRERNILVKVTCCSKGDVELKAVLTKKSIETLRLAVGTSVYAVFKTSAVLLY